MIIIMADSNLPFRTDTITRIYGSTANTVLPDPMLGSFHVDKQAVLLNKCIGDDLEVDPANPIILKKVYDQLGDILYEYTLFEHRGMDTLLEPYYIPISVKRYDYSMPYTYLFTKGLTLTLDILRGQRDYNIISATALMKMFSGNPISFVDSMFTVELPTMIEGMLSELGTYAFHDPTVTESLLRYIFESLSQSYDTLLSYDCPKDYISMCGCADSNVIPYSRLVAHADMTTSRFFEQFAREYKDGLLARVGSFVMLDINCVEFSMFQIPSILNEIYQMPYTDISMEVTQKGAENVYLQKLFGYGKKEFTPQTYIPMVLHDGLIHYNQRLSHTISKLVFSKNWLDDVHLDLYFEDGTVTNFYLNAALYHLYSPSIVRLHKCPI